MAEIEFDASLMCQARANLEARAFQLACKRFVDVILSALLLVLLSPVFLLAALAILADSPGPVIFAHPRWGKGGRTFNCYKFRSMVAVPEAQLAQQVQIAEQAGFLAKYVDDRRVTNVGRLLRRTSIDELPQLWNVLRGDMSLVGPRALVLHMLEPYPDLREFRCLVRPGITGLWQVRARSQNQHVRYMVPHDREYILELGFWRDMSILCRTAGAVWSGSGAV